MIKYTFNPFEKLKNFGNDLSNFWDTITGKNEEKHATKAEELAEQTQQWNETFSKKQLEQQEAQFEKSQALAEENLAFQKDTANKNFQYQQDVFAAQQAENALTRQREDTAYQRQVADLKAAGLSPLMASNGAAATSVQVGSAPQMDTSGISSAYGSYIQMAKEFAELKTLAQGQYASRKQQAINERIGASLALSQMYANRRNQMQNLAVQGFNIATNVASMKARNRLLNLQADRFQEETVWLRNNGFGSRTLKNYLYEAFSTAYSPEQAGQLVMEIINSAKDNIPKAIEEIKNLKNIAPEVKTGIINQLKENPITEGAKNVNNSINNATETAKTNIRKQLNYNRMVNSGSFVDALYSFSDKKRMKYLEDVYNEYEDIFKEHGIYKWQLQNMSKKQLWSMYFNPKKFFNEW